MLSKSQARAFFLGGTGVFSAIFVALSIDSMRQVPTLTREENLTEQVVRGKMIWEDNNCMGCHTLFGEGAYYAPELTKSVERRGKPWLKMFLKDPQKMFPGERKMVQYDFTDAQIDDVIAFLEWCGNVDLQGFPAKPPLKELMQPALANQAIAGKPQPELFKAICAACHSVGGQGGVVGPALDNAHRNKTRDQLLEWIADPQKIKPGSPMPKIEMTEQQLAEIVDYLQSLGGGNTAPSTATQPQVSTESFE